MGLMMPVTWLFKGWRDSTVLYCSGRGDYHADGFFVLVLWTKLYPSKKSRERSDLHCMSEVGLLEVRSDEATRMVVIRLDWWLWQVREIRLISLWKEEERDFLSPAWSCALHRIKAVWDWRMTALVPRREVLPASGSASWTWASRAVRSVCCVSHLLSLWRLVVAAWAELYNSMCSCSPSP